LILRGEMSFWKPARKVKYQDFNFKKARIPKLIAIFSQDRTLRSAPVGDDIKLIYYLYIFYIFPLLFQLLKG
jgi:hypothetical protein